jgi:hypothetical protein
MNHGGDATDLIGLSLAFAVHVGVDVLASLLDITGDIESVTGSLGNGKTVVESDATWDGTESTGVRG